MLAPSKKIVYEYKYVVMKISKDLPTNLVDATNYEIIQYSRTFAPQVQTSWNQAHARLHDESFPKTPRTQHEAS